MYYTIIARLTKDEITQWFNWFRGPWWSNSLERHHHGKRMDRGVLGSNPAAAAYLDLFGPNILGGIYARATTHFELTSGGIAKTHIDEDGDKPVQKTGSTKTEVKNDIYKTCWIERWKIKKIKDRSLTGCQLKKNDLTDFFSWSLSTNVSVEESQVHTLMIKLLHQVALSLFWVCTVFKWEPCSHGYWLPSIFVSIGQILWGRSYRFQSNHLKTRIFFTFFALAGDRTQEHPVLSLLPCHLSHHTPCFIFFL